jgi:PAS domain S-box-containing protein
MKRGFEKTNDELKEELSEYKQEFAALTRCYEENKTRHNLAEKELIISEKRYRCLFESAKDGILILDAETGKIVDVNPFLIEMMGYSKEQFIEKAIWEIGFFKDIVANQDNFLELQQREYIRYENLPLETANGKKTNVEFISNVYLVDNQKVIQCNIRDITDRKLKENEFSNYRNNLEELIFSTTEELAIANNFLTKEREYELALQQSLQHEKELNEMKSKFISTTSHEFRTPLTAILSSSGLLQKYAHNWSKDKKEEHFERINRSVAYLVKLLDDVLTISKTESGDIGYNPEQLDLRKLAKECAKDAKTLLTEKHKLKLRCKSAQKEFTLDKKLMSFIFNNLISNAAKYSPWGGTVSVIIFTNEKLLFIKVSDEGIGIPQEEIGKIFESFYRTRNANNFAGNGLGLAIVKRAVELHKGEITVDSELNKGTTFTVKIPIRRN